MSFDQADAEEVCSWIASKVGGDVPSFPEDLKSGIVLCKLANVLKPGAVPKINPGKLPFHRMENLQNFSSFVRSLGIPDRNNFVSVDLHDEKDLKAVLLSLLTLKRETGGGNIPKGPKGDVFDKLQ